MIPIPPSVILSKAKDLLAPVAARLLSPAVKWGIFGAIILFSNLYTWHWTTLHAEKQKEAELAAQAQHYSDQTANVIEEREKVLQQRNASDRALTEKIINLQRKLVLYERNAKQSTDPAPADSIAMFNMVGSLLSPQNNMPGSSTSTGKPHEPSEADIGVIRVLLTYVRGYAKCGSELASLWGDYDALVAAIRSQYKEQTGE